MHPRYGWVGATRRAAVREAIAACADAWLRDWCLQRESIAVDIEEIEPTTPDVREQFSLVLESDRGTLLLALNALQIGTLGLRLADIKAAAIDGVAREVANKAAADLVSRIAERAGLPQGVRVELGDRPWSEALTRPEWGVLMWRVSVEEIDLMIAMDRAVVNGIVPENATRSALDGRVQSLQTNRVSVTAVLDFGRIGIRELADLHIGEVLVSERKVGELAELRVGNARIAGAAICSLHNQLAVVATAASTPEEKP